MEQVELRVKVIDAELTNLEAKVNALKNTTISFKVDSSGIQALDKELQKTFKLQAEADRAAAKRISAHANEMKAEAALLNAKRLAAQQEAKTTAAIRTTTQSRETAIAVINREIAVINREANTNSLLANSVNEIVAAYQRYVSVRNSASVSSASLGIGGGYSAIGGNSTPLLEGNYVFGEGTSRATVGRQGAVADADWRSVNEASTAVRGFGAASVYANRQYSGLLNNVKKFATWYLIGGAVSGAIRSFKDAISTMKEVDTQLTNIQKVSQMTSAELERIGDAAYETASKYGVAANEYLSAVYTFQKAGLGDSAEKMGELATKTMLVGDTTAEVASKFLIAVNAAWGLNGSITELSKVVDEADYINNNYATDLEKLSSGMPIVASTAANMNMSIEETLAVLGTITSKTQETGTKAATAWRALVMNITGEIGEITDEVDGNIEVTEKSVKAISDALKIYGNEAVRAAQESGRVIDPMEAVISLAEAYKDGLLNDIELENILMDVGGKLRTNQLTALVKDLASETSTYYDILAKLPNAAGTADSEISTMLSSWESKTQILKNTWTEFIAHLIDTGSVKGALDVLIGLIDFLDSGFTKFAVTVGTVTAAAVLLNKAFLALSHTSIALLIKDVIALRSGMQVAAASELSMLIATEGLGAGIKMLTGALLSSPLFWAAAGTAAIYGIVKLFDALTVSAEEAKDAFDDASSAYEDAEQEISSLNDKLAENKKLLDEANASAENDVYVKRLQAENEEIRRQIGLQEVQARNARDAKDSAAVTGLTGAKDYQIVTGTNEYYDMERDDTLAFSQYENVSLRDAVKHYLTLAETTGTVDERLGSLIETLSEYRDGLSRTTPLSNGLYNETGKLIDRYLALYPSVESVTDATEDASDAAESAADANEKLSYAEQNGLQTADQLKSAIDAVSAATKDYADLGGLTEKTIEDLNAAIPGLVDSLYDEEGQLSDVGIAALESKDSLGDLLLASLNAESKINGMSFADAIASLNQLRNTAAEAAAALSIASVMSSSPLSVIQGSAGTFLSGKFAASQANALQAQIDAVIAQNTDAVKKIVSGIGSGSTKSGGGSSSKKDEELEQRKAAVELLKSELSLMQKRGDSEEAQVRKMKEIRSALQDEIDYLEANKGDRADINNLIGEQYDIEQDILGIQKEQLETVKELIEKYYDTQNDALNDQKDALEKARDAEQDRLSISEKELAVEKARAALENAQNERNVRQYNSATGQWEWVSNASTVRSAQEAYDDALNALRDFENDLAYQAQKTALEQEIKSNEEMTSRLNEALQAFIDAMNTGSGNTDAAFENLVAILKDANGLSDDLREQIVISLMKANAANWATASPEEKERLHDYNAILGEIIQASYDSASGVWYNKNGGQLFGGDGVGGGGNYQIGETSSAGQTITGEVNVGSDGNASSGLSTGTIVHTANGDYQIVDANYIGPNGEKPTQNPATGYWSIRVHDVGGVLKGIGGIKATSQDELVLPPDITRKMLTPTLDATTLDRFAELRYLYGGGNKPSGLGGASIGTQHNGNVYNMNGITLTEGQARSTTVYDLVRYSRGLKIYNSVN